MPNRNIYVRESAVELWERAERLAEERGESLSEMLTDALREELERLERETLVREELDGVMQQIEVVVNKIDPRTGFITAETQPIRFIGAPIAESPRTDVYLTQAGKIVVIHDAGTHGTLYYVYDSFEDLQEEEENLRDQESPHRLGDEMLTEIVEAIGEEWVVWID